MLRLNRANRIEREDVWKSLLCVVFLANDAIQHVNNNFCGRNPHEIYWEPILVVIVNHVMFLVRKEH
ncbi:hypothetical protein RB195_008817 [Necator americanus]|uniref:Uncharacterized protein n=1 Tax=Necator americanus TaxID=51031 RepID=A0ABR1CQG5_NECAM